MIVLPIQVVCAVLQQWLFIFQGGFSEPQAVSRLETLAKQGVIVGYD